jgi:hypothetical protein
MRRSWRIIRSGGIEPATVTQLQGSEKNPATTCKAERASLGADAFAEKYGTNLNLRNAFGSGSRGARTRHEIAGTRR